MATTAITAPSQGRVAGAAIGQGGQHQGQEHGREGRVEPESAGVVQDRSRQHAEHDGHVPAPEQGEATGPERWHGAAAARAGAA